MWLNELPAELRDRIVVRHGSREGYKEILLHRRFPREKWTSTILQWKKFVMTKALLRAGWAVRLSDWGGREVTKTPLVELQRSCVETGETFRGPAIAAALHRLYGRGARRKPLFGESLQKKPTPKNQTQRILRRKPDLMREIAGPPGSFSRLHAGSLIYPWVVLSHLSYPGPSPLLETHRWSFSISKSAS